MKMDKMEIRIAKSAAADFAISEDLKRQKQTPCKRIAGGLMRKLECLRSSANYNAVVLDVLDIIAWRSNLWPVLNHSSLISN